MKRLARKASLQGALILVASSAIADADGAWCYGDMRLQDPKAWIR